MPPTDTVAIDDRDENRGSHRHRPAPVLLAWLMVGVALLVGTAQRAWLFGHIPLFGDEAVVGLMARRILEGHFYTFYWGQSYGGLEPYVAAAVIRIFGGGTVTLNLTAALLSAGASALVFGIITDMSHNRTLALLGGAITWVWPYALVWNSVHEVGFRFAELCCGLALVYMSVRFSNGDRSTRSCALIGLFLGAGWWASPEIVYFALPSAVMILGSWRRPNGQSASRQRTLIALITVGAVIGAFPWIWTNISDGFQSLRSSGLPATSGGGYFPRLEIFFQHVLPTQLGLRALLHGQWLGSNVIGIALYLCLLVVLVATVIRAFSQTGTGHFRLPQMAIAGTLLMFPLIASASPASGYWADGRYGIYLGPLIVICLLTTWLPIRADNHRSPAKPIAVVATALLLGAIVLTQLGGRAASGTPSLSPDAFATGWVNPDAAVSVAIAQMHVDGIHFAYGDYWTSYVIDFIGNGTVTVSPSPVDVNRTPYLRDEVSASTDPAWLFYNPGEVTQASEAFSNPQVGPGDFTEANFLSLLQNQHVAFRVRHLGILDAIVPDGSFRL